MPPSTEFDHSGLSLPFHFGLLRLGEEPPNAAPDAVQEHRGHASSHQIAEEYKHDGEDDAQEPDSKFHRFAGFD